MGQLNRALSDNVSVFNGVVRRKQDDASSGRVNAEDEDFRNEVGDLLGREVDHADHLPTDQVGRGVALRDLGAGTFDAEGPKVDPEAISGTSSFGKRLSAHNGACTNVKCGKSLPRYLWFGNLTHRFDLPDRFDFYLIFLTDLHLISLNPVPTVVFVILSCAGVALGSPFITDRSEDFGV